MSYKQYGRVDLGVCDREIPSSLVLLMNGKFKHYLHILLIWET